MSVQPAALYWADPCISDTWPAGLLHLAWNTQPLNGFAFNTNTTNTNTNGTIQLIQLTTKNGTNTYSKITNSNTWPTGLLQLAW